MNPFFQDVLERLAWTTPFFVMMGVGIWICIKYRQNNPALSKLASYAFLVFCLNNLVSILNHAWFATLPKPNGTQGMISIAKIYAVTSGFTAILNLVGWGVLLLALYRALQPNNGASAA